MERWGVWVRALDWAIKKDEIGTTLKSSSFSIKMSNEKDFKEVCTFFVFLIISHES